MMDESKQQQQQQQQHFGEDIYTEILLRLPVNSLLKLSSVSKLFLSIVSDPQFRQNHSSRHMDSMGLFFEFDHCYGLLTLNINPNISYFNLSTNRPKGHMPSTCMSSCNGLHLSKSAKCRNPDQTYCVSNPTTKEFVFLDIPSHIRHHKFVLASLAFDPCQSLDYKVIFLWCQHMYSKDFHLEVYSSSTGECKLPACNTYVSRNFDYDEHICGIFWNGAIHWLSTNAASVIYFNLHTESINEISTPYLARNVHYFGESRGHLHLVHSDHQHIYQSSVLQVYELERDYSDWFLKYKVELASIASALPQHNVRKDYGTFMNIFREEDDDSTLVLLLCGQWVEYSLNKKTTRMLFEYAPFLPCTSPFPWTYWFNTFQFIPTLTSV